MKKLFLFTLIALAGLTFWALEPYSNNPLEYPTDSPVFHETQAYSCKKELPAFQRLISPKVDELFDSKKILGMSAGFYNVRCGRYVFSGGYQFKREPLEFKPSTITRVASLTKPMTAIALLQLQEESLLTLDDPLRMYLPEIPIAWYKITLRQLLNHSSGIPHYNSKLDAMSFKHYRSLKEASEPLLEKELQFFPGTRYLYSSYGYTILGRVIEEVSKKDYETYMRENIWLKAGMNDTSLEQMHDIANKSRLYIKLDKFFLRSPNTDLSIIYPAEGVQSTAGDILKFAEAILSDTLVSRESLEQMIDVKNALSPTGGDDPYGLGWAVIETKNEGRVLLHGGAQPGASAQLMIYLDKGIASVVLSNAFGTKQNVTKFAQVLAGMSLLGDKK